MSVDVGHGCVQASMRVIAFSLPLRCCARAFPQPLASASCQAWSPHAN